VSKALTELKRTIMKLPQTPSLSAYLASSMVYRDALNGLYAFGGVYAKLVLGWSVVDIGIFGILAVITGALFAFLGGRADRRFGSKPVIVWSILILMFATVGIASIAPGEVAWLAVSDAPQVAGRTFSDIAFYVCGALIGAAGGTVQAASRAMLVRQGNPYRMTEAFGLLWPLTRRSEKTLGRRANWSPRPCSARNETARSNRRRRSGLMPKAAPPVWCNCLKPGRPGAPTRSGWTRISG